MTSVRMTGGRERRRSRGGALNEALVAAGEPPLLTTYETTQGSPCDRFFHYTASQSGFTEMSASRWPTEEQSVSAVKQAPLFRDGDQAVYRLLGGTIVYVGLNYGFAYVRVAAETVTATEEALAIFQQVFPATFRERDDGGIPITFWTMGPHGPEPRLRVIETASWEAVEENYPADVRASLDGLMDGFEPGKDGQLLLWQGPPGTGKTWALRALASEWRSWAEFSYITDPDAFFVERPSYMVDVLLADSYSVIDTPTGDVYEEAPAEGKWRVLILEDTGELLSATAKEKYGQGLSRLLNVVDGLIGQGLRVLCLVTTNDELGELNEAVRRPGRCASQIVFPPFSEDEANAWLAHNGYLGTVLKDTTVAELYDILSKSDVGPPVEDALTAAADPEAEIIAAVQAVAEQHQDDAVGYGETAYQDGTVYWIHGDWTDHDPARDDFLAIDGVNDVVCEAEGIPDGWPYAAVVYPDPAPRWVTTPPEKAQAALDSLIQFASEPLDL